MSNSNYTLEIISHHPKFNAKALKKYYVDGIETVGAWGDEPFEICFRNNTWQKVQIKLSLDGTDILTGKPADTQVSKDMWVVNGYSSISLKAWPENDFGGAAFVFTSANNSVAVHTHGDLSSRGIIAVAVFVEGHVEPIKVMSPIVIEKHHHHHDCWPYHNYQYYNDNTILGGGYSSSGNLGGLQQRNVIFNNNVSGTRSSNDFNTAGFNGGAGDIFFGAVDIGETAYSAGDTTKSADPVRSTDNRRSRKSLEKLVSVGAGQHVDQKITYVAGLIKPIFTETIRVKYVWWDELVEHLKSNNVPAPHASGFPGDKGRGINLGNTPRLGHSKRAKQSQVVYSRV